MTHTSYLGYATTGRELEVEESLTERGLDAWCAKEIKFIRRGKRRFFEADERPYLPNYVLLSITDDQWHELHARPEKYLAPTFTYLSRLAVREIETFREYVDGKYHEAKEIADRNEQAEMCEYKAGDKLEIASGPLADVMLTFRRIVEDTETLLPLIEASFVIFGKEHVEQFDPLEIKAAE